MARDPKRKFYLNGYGRHPENYTWHYEMLKKLAAINTNILDQSTGSILAPTATDAFGRLRTSSPFTLFDSNYRYGDNGKWQDQSSTGGSLNFNADEATMELNVTTAAAAGYTRETFRVMAYQPGKSLTFMSSFVMSPAQLNLRQRVGYFDDNNGFFLERNNFTFGFVKRSSVEGRIEETTVYQSAWNGDKLDGTGPSGITLDLDDAQILWADFEWLGVGSVRMGFVIDGKFIVCHTFHHANEIQSTYITTACLPLRYEIYNTGVINNPATLKQICSTVLSEGGYELRGEQYNAGTTIGSPIGFTTANTFERVVSLRLKNSKKDAISILSNLSVIGQGNNKYYQWRIRRRVQDISTSYNSVSPNIEVQYGAPTGSEADPGEVVATGFFSSSNQGANAVNLTSEFLFDLQFERTSGSEELSFVLDVAVDTTSGGEGVYGSVEWRDIIV